MATKLATQDASTLNRLYASEMQKFGAKGDSKLQAFKDHEGVLDILESILSADGKPTPDGGGVKQSFPPNDPILD